MTDYTDLGKRLRAIRKAAHLTQEQLAAKADMSTSFLGHIERGSRVSSLESIVSLCNVLNISPNHLLAASLTAGTGSERRELSDAERERLLSFLSLASKTVDSRNH